MQLEESVLLIELFPLLFVKLSDLGEELAPVLAHFAVQLLLRIVEAHSLHVLLLEILASLLLPQVLPQELIVLLLQTLDVGLFPLGCVLFGRHLLLRHRSVEFFDFLGLSEGPDAVRGGGDPQCAPHC